MKSYVHYFCTDTRWILVDLRETINNGEWRGKRERKGGKKLDRVRATNMTWGCSHTHTHVYIYIYIYIYILPLFYYPIYLCYTCFRHYRHRPSVRSCLDFCLVLSLLYCQYSCFRSRDELIRDVLLWIPTHGRAKAGRPARTYIQQLCEDTGCCPEDLPRAMNDREEWRERVRDIRATSAIWWWWWFY